MSYLIIPDVHNRVEWAEKLVNAFPDRQAVFLGDYFDHFEDTPEDARRTAEWLRFSIEKGRIHLMGNHDLPYRWAGHFCPGYTPEKRKAIAKIMTDTYWNETRLALIITQPNLRPLVLSHAGFSLTNLYGVTSEVDVAPATRFLPAGRLAHLRDLGVEAYLGEIRTQWPKCVSAASGGYHHHWLNQGDRMGEIDIGGPLWLDKDSMFSPLPGVDQIVGHSHVDKPRRRSMPNWSSSERDLWYIDGGGQYAALVDTAPNGVGGLKVTPIWTRGDRIGETVAM